MDSHPYTDIKASIALLRRVRAGDHIHFVHRVDVCDAVPEALLADLDPVPGTCHDDDEGYSSLWYCYHAKKYKNTRGDNSGHRHRAVAGGGGASWHSEISRREVKGSGGGTFCNLSYGRKTDPSSNSIDRMGWCMVEYDLKEQGDVSNSNYVLCKVYRSSRAKGKSASTSSSKNAASSTKKAGKKRKAGGGDHPEAPPAKVTQQEEQEQEQVQQENAYYCYDQLPQQGVESEHGSEFFNDFNIEDINFYVDVLQGAMPEPGLHQQQQPIADLEHDGQSIQLPCDNKDLNMEEFTVEWLLRGQPQQQQPMIMEPPQKPGHGDDEFIQMPCGPVVPAVPEATFEEMLGLGPDAETVYGMMTASVPWSSYDAQTSSPSSYTPCSSLLQGPNNPHRFPYLMG